jgi:hypothetical protein
MTDYSQEQIKRFSDEQLAAEIDSLDFAIDALQSRIDALNSRLAPLVNEYDARAPWPDVTEDSELVRAGLFTVVAGPDGRPRYQETERGLAFGRLLGGESADEPPTSA